MLDTNKTVLMPSPEAGDSLTSFKGSRPNISQHARPNNFTNNMANQQPQVNQYQSVSYQNTSTQNTQNIYLLLAKPLFKYLNMLLQTYNITDVKQIHQNLLFECDNFYERGLNEGLDGSQLMVAKYILCTFLDELICTTYWGKEYDWAHKSLLAHYFQETYGGEKFFQLLSKMLQTPSTHIYILELMYICIALGFEGKYRIMPKGKMDLDAIRENLYRQIKAHYGRDNISCFTLPNPSKKQSNYFYKVPYLKISVIFISILLGIYILLTIPLATKESGLYPFIDGEISYYNLSKNKSETNNKKEDDVTK